MLFGFILGVIVTAAFILYGNGELLIQLGEQIKRTSERFWAWQRERTLPK
ncbi:MAG TPA: hypothetical protein VNN62_17660 [Methylomirabilota bacterium]|jgi:hypothetical protein|nr:hypothetical protein [Methylomirabilota bacterium]